MSDTRPYKSVLSLNETGDTREVLAYPDNQLIRPTNYYIDPFLGANQSKVSIIVARST